MGEKDLSKLRALFKSHLFLFHCHCSVLLQLDFLYRTELILRQKSIVPSVLNELLSCHPKFLVGFKQIFGLSSNPLLVDLVIHWLPSLLCRFSKCGGTFVDISGSSDIY